MFPAINDVKLRSFNLRMETYSLINLTTLVAYILGFVSNFISFRYITLTYDTKKSPYYILALDSAFATVMSIVGSFCGIYDLFFQAGPIVCSLKNLSNPMIVAIQTSLAFLISLIRIKRVSLNAPNGWRPEPKLISIANWLVIGIFLASVTLIILNSVFELNMSVIYNFCMERHFSQINFWPLFICILLPLTISSLATAAMDISCFCMVDKKFDQIPLRASVISTILVFPSFLFTVFLSHVIQVSAFWRFLTILITQHLMIIIRNPIIALVAFRVNETNRFQNRETNRQLEISFAMKARQERRIEFTEEQSGIFTVSQEFSKASKVNSLPDVSI